MKRIQGIVKLTMVGLLTGSAMFQVGSCSAQDLKVQLSRGLTTTLNGLFNVLATDLANEIFDVDD
ncbi:MAG: hypothetical protein JSV78_06665 [Phycisphaerales bacterium]|nr:MAG: hypothetical protein JSV78_06665 [Phycisphaerales bacterium]